MSAALVRIAMVAGEASGDLIGAHIIDALKTRLPNVEFFGIGGPKMLERGFSAWWPQEKLAVNGYLEVIKHFRELYGIRQALKKRLLHERPDAFIGIDAPDFNLNVEATLKTAGIPAIHYVSPSIWAWRRERIYKIAQSISHMLVLFPFEQPIYRQAQIPVTYVGHPLADMLPFEDRGQLIRKKLEIPPEQAVFALLPGSRQSEIAHMAGVFIETAKRIHQALPDALFIVPFVTEQTQELFAQIQKKLQADDLPLRLMLGKAHDAMAAADTVLVACGTATLEAALLKRPMVIVYKTSAFTAHIARKRVRVPYVGLPNILAGRFVVPELLQEDATPDNLSQALLNVHQDPVLRTTATHIFRELHLNLRQGTAKRAASAIIRVLAENRVNATSDEKLKNNEAQPASS